MNSYNLILLALLITITSYLEIVEAQICIPSGEINGVSPPPGGCNQENYSGCCEQGKIYPTYTCSPPVDNNYHSDDTPVVALSTGWFNDVHRCMNNVAITGNGRTIVAMVVDECDSTMGCDDEHDYQPPCSDNIVDASKAVWKALGVSEDNWGQLEIVWSDA
ncbi:hypothetical protein MKX01_005170 [Papaver californicum]|nr:hypothetical protein MKX01_005170 [Papaver californicum]